MKKKHFERMLVYVILVIICMISLFPFIWTAFAATHSNTQFFDLSYTFRPGGELHSNYEDLLASFPLWRNMANSLLIALIYTAGAVLIDTMRRYIGAFSTVSPQSRNHPIPGLFFDFSGSTGFWFLLDKARFPW